MKVFRRTSKEDPEVQVVNAINSFCARGKAKKGLFGTSGEVKIDETHDDVTQLPVIVECAQATANAAREAVRATRKQLDPKRGGSSASQCRAVMVLRILVDAGSDNVLAQVEEDEKLVSVVRSVMRQTGDLSLRQMMIDALAHFADKKELKRLKGVNDEYKSRIGGEKMKEVNIEKIEGLIEEAKSSAGLLQQVLSTTPPAQMAGSPLVMEFYDRCTKLKTKIQSYLSREYDSPLQASIIMNLISASDTIDTAMDQHKLLMDRAAALVSPPREYYEEQEDDQVNMNGHVRDQVLVDPFPDEEDGLYDSPSRDYARVIS
ncbi:hypothetical protein V1512DRAFT_255068 [Lipomyces arxii]|uniref:uncharacterized protein n=1 Tax=Lipomyces arxii TaxID=56418 RepID=UPI0034CD6341